MYHRGMTLRPFGSRPESDLENAEETASALRAFLTKLAASNISFGKVLAGGLEPCFPTLYQDIDVRAREGEPGQGMVFDFSLRSHADGANPGKNARFYHEFKNIVETFQHPGSVMEYGPLLNGKVADGDERPVVAYRLTHAESEEYADKIAEWTRKLDGVAKHKASWKSEAGRF
jgi:hypothetical protein